MNTINFGIALEKVLKEKNVTHTELAKVVHTNIDVVLRWVQGVTCPNLDSVRKICRALNVSADVLLDIKLKKKAVVE